MNTLNISQFKCFENISIPLDNLTVFVGANGYGKSTAIQALLFLRSTIEEYGHIKNDIYHKGHKESCKIALNEKYCLALGTSTTVINRNYDSNVIKIGIEDVKGNVSVEYLANNDVSELFLQTHSINIPNNSKATILLRDFYYLNAERLGPRFLLPNQYNDSLHAGWQGENTAQVLNLENGFFKIDSNRMFVNSKSQYIMDQANLWLDYIIPGVRVRVESNPKTLTSQILLENFYTKNEPTLATNIGFGISYVLPIIANGLIAKKGSYFIVENPEAHLHPSAQSRIARFLSVIAATGVNVVIETHSDHIINGIQISAAENKMISDKVTIVFFSFNNKNNQPLVQKINMSDKGELTDWPVGFFDQTQKDFAELLKHRRNE